MSSLPSVIAFVTPVGRPFVPHLSKHLPLHRSALRGLLATMAPALFPTTQPAVPQQVRCRYGQQRMQPSAHCVAPALWAITHTVQLPRALTHDAAPEWEAPLWASLDGAPVHVVELPVRQGSRSVLLRAAGMHPPCSCAALVRLPRGQHARLVACWPLTCRCRA